MRKSESVEMNPSRWLKCVSTQGNIRGVAIQATELVQEMVEIHQLKGEAISRLGEAVIGALLISSYCKEGERVNLNIQGSELIQQALVDAYPDGRVRGYVVEREAASRIPQAGNEEGPGPWGEGFISVLRTKMEEFNKPYIGTVPMVTGFLAKDLTFYWMQSEQVLSAVGLAVNRAGDRVIAAGGFLVQALPGASTDEVRTIEEHIQEMQSLAEGLTENSDPMSLLSQIFQSTAFILLEERPLKFECTCSWERVRRALTLIGVDELRSMIEEDNGASVRCDFCTKEYKLDAAGLNELIQEVSR